MSVDADRIGDAVRRDETQRRSCLVAGIHSDPEYVAMVGAIEVSKQRRLALAGRAPGREEPDVNKKPVTWRYTLATERSQ
jgi:hypothetical protein